MRGIIEAGLHAMPLVTRVTFVCQVIGVVAGVAFPSVVNAACLQPSKALMYFQLHRLLTYAVLHQNLIHFVLNMVGLLTVSPRLEAAMGSVRYGHIFLVMTMVVAIVYSLGAALAYLIVGINFSFWNICTIGLTSPLLTMGVIYVYCFSVSSSVVTVHGLQLPPTVLPPLLLICTHFLPTTSFWCNFAGIALGYMYVQGVVQQRVQLSSASVRVVEESGLGLYIKPWPCFVSCPDLALPTTAADAVDRMPSAAPHTKNLTLDSRAAPHTSTVPTVAGTSAAGTAWRQGKSGGLSTYHSGSSMGDNGSSDAGAFQPYRPPRRPSDPAHTQLYAKAPPPATLAQHEQCPQPQQQQHPQHHAQQHVFERVSLSSSSHASEAVSIGPVSMGSAHAGEDDADEFFEPASSLNVSQ